MQIIQFGYGFFIPYKYYILPELDNDMVSQIKYCWDTTLSDDDKNKIIFVYTSGFKFSNGIIPYSFHLSDYVKIPSKLEDGITKLLDKLYIKYVNKSIDYSQISWKFFSYYEK